METNVCNSDDDNWDDDFATAISPSALQLPHLRPQDNFGGLLSADKLKAFASVNDLRGDVNNYDNDFEGDMMTIKGPNNELYQESQEQTIRPVSRRMTASKPASPPKVVHQASRPTLSQAVTSPNLSRTKSPPKPHFGNKFELPPRPGAIYREQSSEDYSDLFSDDDSVFDQKVHQAVRKVSFLFLCAHHPIGEMPNRLTGISSLRAACVNLKRLSSSTRPT